MAFQYSTVEGVFVGTQVTAVYIRLLDNGYYGLCDEKEAQGVVINGQPFHLEGREELEGLETVTVTEINGNFYMHKLEEENKILQAGREEQQEMLDIITGESEGVANENQNES